MLFGPRGLLEIPEQLQGLFEVVARFQGFFSSSQLLRLNTTFFFGLRRVLQTALNLQPEAF
jgi:hypothetical protein